MTLFLRTRELWCTEVFFYHCNSTGGLTGTLNARENHAAFESRQLRLAEFEFRLVADRSLF